MGRLSLLLLAVAACGGAATAPSTPTPIAASPPVAAAEVPPPVGFRLPAGSRPTAYRVTLDIDPAGETIGGEGEIDIQREAAGPLYLHASEISVGEASWRGAGGEIALRSHVVDDDMIAFAGVPAGEGTLRLRWKARLRRDDTHGAFAQPTDGLWYAYSQFEPMDARRVFPCFDEPAFKVPWTVSLRVPKDLVALSNSPAVGEKLEGERKLVSFAPTPALPSYLIAFAVGPFDIIEAGTSKGGVPIRVIVPKGHAEEAKFPVEDTKPILDRLEDYFGMPYPFAKLDSVVIPDTIGFGAMENPGLVTYVSSLMLTRPGQRTVQDRRAHAGTCAHELAHQWFGNLVTMAWWDDIWLNEAFASWMGDKIIEDWQPDWDVGLGRVSRKNRVVGLDSNGATRRIREPVLDENAAEDAFDGITYSKGMLVLGMLEEHLGAETFRKGMQHYMATHARGNATYADLAAALSHVSGQDVRAIADPFVDQVGAPLVEMTLVCRKGESPRLSLAQRRYLPIGSKLDVEKTWHIPLSVRWKAGRSEGVARTVLTTAQGELVLAGAKACPELLVPNPEGLSYVVWSGQGPAFARLYEVRTLRSLPAASRLEVLESLRAAVNAGSVPYRRLVEVAAPLLDDPERLVRYIAVGVASGVGDWLPAAALPAYRAWAKRTYGRTGRALGFVPRPGESDDDKLFRSSVLARLVYDAEDVETIAEATRLTWAWFDDKQAIAPDLVDSVLAFAAFAGDARLHDRFLAEARKASAAHDKPLRERALDALAAFRGPELEARTLALTLGDEFPVFETWTYLFSVGKHERDGKARTFAFVREHYDALVARLPEKLRGRLVTSGASCTAEGLAQARAFFAERTPKEQSGPRKYARFVDDELQCIARQPGVVASLTEMLTGK